MHAPLSPSLYMEVPFFEVVVTSSHFGNVYFTLLSVGLKVNYSKVVKVKSKIHLFMTLDCEASTMNLSPYFHLSIWL